jgi:DNA-binding MarR family transcriptional regulator
MDYLPERDRDLILLEQIAKSPDATQASLATMMGVAVGTINWHLKRLVAKGYVKVRRAERRKLLYIATPEGLALRAHLTLDYIQNSFRLYRLVRQRMVEQLAEVRIAGFQQIHLDGEGDVAEVCRLTCLEQNIEVVDNGDVPWIRIRDLKVLVEMPGMPGIPLTPDAQADLRSSTSRKDGHSVDHKEERSGL